MPSRVPHDYYLCYLCDRVVEYARAVGQAKVCVDCWRIHIPKPPPVFNVLPPPRPLAEITSITIDGEPLAVAAENDHFRWIP